jgi:hypothetical protein
MGLDGEYAAWYGMHHDRGREADAYLKAHPAVQELAHQEKLHNQIKDSFSKAFVERQKREGKK